MMRSIFFLTALCILPLALYAATRVDSATALLMHADGGDATTLFFDTGYVPKTMTAAGNAQVDTAQFKFGGASALFDGTGDYISVADSADWDFGTADFTIDFWARFNTVTGRQFLIDLSTNLVRLEKTNANTMEIYVGGASVATPAWTPSANTWYHVALARDGSNLRLFIDGTQIGTTITNSTNITGVTEVIIGAHTGSLGSLNMNGWIDEVRISKGIARWTANFTPPTEPYGGDDITLSNTVTVSGNVSVVNSISKGSGTFMIDHPLDPKNKLLYHSFVESPDVLNMYDGIVTLDARGEATVTLPDYFLALNKDFTYLTTPIGTPMPNLHIHDEIRRKILSISHPIVFTIAGGEPMGKVSWQVKGIRKDPFIRNNPIIPEVKKSDETVVGPDECIFEPLCT